MNPSYTHASAGTANLGLRVIVYNEVDGGSSDLLFDHFPVRIGRNQLNELVLNHQYVSQWHAMIVYEHNALSMVQVGSSNSVLVNDHRLSPQETVQLTGAEAIKIVPFHLQVQLVNIPSPTLQTYQENSVIREAGVVGTDQQALESIALRSLDHLYNKFLGLNLQDPQEAAAFAGRIEETLDVFMRFFVALQKGQEQFRQAMDIRLLDSMGSSPVERASDSGELAGLLLSTANPGMIRELEHAFKNIMIHQVALLNGLMAGVRTLLGKLSPESVKKEASESRRSPGAKLLWQTYARIHADLAEEDNETFETIFGPQFGKAYSALVGKKADGKKKKR